jgi:hypothetical protein
VARAGAVGGRGAGGELERERGGERGRAGESTWDSVPRQAAVMNASIVPRWLVCKRKRRERREREKVKGRGVGWGGGVIERSVNTGLVVPFVRARV